MLRQLPGRHHGPDSPADGQGRRRAAAPPHQRVSRLPHFPEHIIPGLPLHPSSSSSASSPPPLPHSFFLVLPERSFQVSSHPFSSGEGRLYIYTPAASHLHTSTPPPSPTHLHLNLHTYAYILTLTTPPARTLTPGRHEHDHCLLLDAVPPQKRVQQCRHAPHLQRGRHLD